MEDLTHPAEINTTVRLFNNVYFDRTLPQATCDIQPWAPFPRLPPELRLHVWQLFLQQHRMIELELRFGNNQDKSLWYTAPNHLGRIVSGRGYLLDIGNRGYSASLSPLLWVNSEARQATLHFYRVHLPFRGLGADRLLYLNPEYDVLYIDSEKSYATLLPDLLHDVRAYDPKDQGYGHTPRHIGVVPLVHMNPHVHGDYPLEFTPADLHPAAAASFADILRTRLRSVLCVVNFRSFMRGIGEPPPGGCPYHFAQTFPLCRRDNPAGAFSWLETDPRLGVELDLRILPFTTDPRPCARYWAKLERAFGIGERAKDEGFCFYICSSINWPGHQYQMLGQEGSREELTQHLRCEEADWLFIRQHIWDITRRIMPGSRLFPRHGPFVDAETFEMMEKAPSTAIGMWLFPAEAFTEPNRLYLPKCVFDMSAARPGLFLFEV